MSEAILNAPCPFFERKKVSETHMLILLPAKVDRRPLTINYLGKLMQKHFPKTEAGYQYIWDKILVISANRNI